MFTIGKRYRLHGKFNYGATFSGELADIDNNFMKFVKCHDLKNVPGDEIIVNINWTEAIWPVKE